MVCGYLGCNIAGHRSGIGNSIIIGCKDGDLNFIIGARNTIEIFCGSIEIPARGRHPCI